MKSMSIVAGALALLLGAAACSSHAAPPAGQGSSTGGAADSSAPTANSGTALAGGSFGSLGAVCGDGTASGSTDVGVSDTAIHIATVADVGATAAPGLNQAFWDSATAFVDWCNAAGGILGRKLVLDKRDAKLTDYLPIVNQSCPVDFAMVGGQSAGDDTGLSARLACKLPDIAPYIFGPQSVDAKLRAAAFPTPNDQVFLGGVHTFFQKFAGTQSAVGAVFPGGATGAQQEKIFTEGLKAIGGKLISVLTYNQGGQVSWTPLVAQLRKAGVKLLLIDADPGSTASLEQAMQSQNWWPEVQVGAPHLYDQQFLKALRIPAQNFYVYTPIVPIEDAPNNPPTQQYIDIVKKYVPNGQIGFPGVESFSAMLLFAQAAKSCGSNLTRDCVMGDIAKTKSWTGGGLTSTADPGDNAMPQCYVVMKITGGTGKLTYERYEPANGFDCSSDNAPHIKP